MYRATALYTKKKSFCESVDATTVMVARRLLSAIHLYLYESVAFSANLPTSIYGPTVLITGFSRLRDRFLLLVLSTYIFEFDTNQGPASKKGTLLSTFC